MVAMTLLSSSVAALFLAASFVDAKVYRTKVAILGGGVAGISASLNLTAAGVTDFMLIEARDVLGGRAQNVPFANVSVELGCNWVQGLGTNPINQLALKYKLKTAPSYSEDVVWYNEKGKYNGTGIYNRMNDYYDKMIDIGYKKIKNDLVDVNVRAGLALAGWFPSTPEEKAAEYYVWDWEAGEAPEFSSTAFGAVSQNWTYTSGFGPDGDGNNFVIDPRGFKHIFLEEAKKVFKSKNDPRLKLNTTVKKIEYSKQGGVIVHTTKGDTIHADYAITTFSLGVLQHKDIEWSPALPDWKLEGLYAFHMATYTKIFFNFPYQFWDDNQFVVWADPDRRGYFNSWQNLNAPGGYFPKNTSTNVFFVTTTQDLSYYVESRTDKEVKDEIMVVLRQMYGDDIPEPTDFMFPRWTSNPLFRGSYSNWPIGELDEHHVNMRAPLHNRVFFAGEAMSEQYYGFLQGAWITGAETGAQVAQCVKSKCSPSPYYTEIVNAKIKSSIVRRSFLKGLVIPY